MLHDARLTERRHLRQLKVVRNMALLRARAQKRLDMGSRPICGKIMSCLKVKPKLRSGLKRLREQPRRFGRNTSLTANDFIDTLN
jgi:hypothetical protein